MIQRRRLSVGFLIAFGVLLFSPRIFAQPQYAKAAQQECQSCHVNPHGGGELRPLGKAFAQNRHVWPVDLAPWTSPDDSARQRIRFATGLVHAAAAVLWFATIAAMCGLPLPKILKASRAPTIVLAILLASGVVLTFLRYFNLRFLPLLASGRVVMLKGLIAAALIALALFRPQSTAEAHDRTRVAAHLGAAIIVIALLFFVQ